MSNQESQGVLEDLEQIRLQIIKECIEDIFDIFFCSVAENVQKCEDNEITAIEGFMNICNNIQIIQEKFGTEDAQKIEIVDEELCSQFMAMAKGTLDALNEDRISPRKAYKLLESVCNNTLQSIMQNKQGKTPKQIGTMK